MIQLKRIGVFTSGGDSPGMNSAIREIVLQANRRNIEVIGFHDGYRGILGKDYLVLTPKEVKDIGNMGGTILGTSRYIEFQKLETRVKAIEILKSMGVSGLIGIGGDGSYHGLLELKKLGYPVIGIPGTVDNDIPLTDFTLGFWTAVANCVDAIDKIRTTMESHHRLFIVQVMGRYCGDIAEYSGRSASADFIYNQKNYHGFDQILNDVREFKKKGNRDCLIVISENILDIQSLAETISEANLYEVRYEVLGHLQRGGNTCIIDRLLGQKFGKIAVDCLSQGCAGKAVSLQNNKISCVPLEDVLSVVQKGTI